jgi:hypothetical protein
MSSRLASDPIRIAVPAAGRTLPTHGDLAHMRRRTRPAPTKFRAVATANDDGGHFHQIFMSGCGAPSCLYTAGLRQTYEDADIGAHRRDRRTGRGRRRRPG